jgi:hypothetical protein
MLVGSDKGMTLRLFAMDFDSMAQARVLRTPGSTDPIDVLVWREYVAYIRLASLLSRQILLTDSQVLDGAFFLEAGPARCAGMLGELQDVRWPRLPITVLARRPTLEASLAEMFSFATRPASERRPPLLSALAATDPLDLRTELCRLPAIAHEELAPGEDVVAAVIALLERAKIHRHDLERLTHGWRAWIAADHGRLMAVQQWPAHERSFAEDFKPGWEALGAEIESTHGRAFLDRLLHQSPDEHRAFAERTRFLLELVDALPGTHVGTLDDDARRFLDRYNAMYYRTLAARHRAQWIEFTPQRNDERRSFWLRLRRRRNDGATALRLRLSSELLRSIGSMPTSVYERIVFRSRQAREQFIASPSLVTRARLNFVLVSETEPATTGTARTVGLIVVIVLLGVIANFAEDYFDKGTVQKFLIVGLAVVLSAFELIVRLYEFSAMRLAAVVSIE